MQFNQISTKLGLIFISFSLLVLVSWGVTFWGLNTQKMDAATINLAGRQRMLLQQISRLVSELELSGDQQLLTQIQTSQGIYAQTLNALRDGGQAPYLGDIQIDLPPTRSQIILDQIATVSRSWKAFQDNLTAIAGNPLDSQEHKQAIREIKATTPILVDEVDQLVHLYEQQANGRVDRLRNVQTGFVICAVVLLLSSFWGTRQFIIRPLSDLGKAARQIGAGAMETPVEVSGDAEIELLSNTMEEMRSNLLASKSELVNWAATLEERVSQRTQELESLQQVSQEITSRLDIKSVLNSIVEKARHLLNADVAFLCLLDTSGTTLSLQSNSGPVQAISSTMNTLKDSWAEQVIASETAICNQGAYCTGDCGVVNIAFRRSQLAVPLSFDQRVIGALCVASKEPDFFTNESIALLTRLANIASLALENATLYTQLERSSMLEERHRIAADMHDGLAQTLSFLGLALEQAKTQLASGDTSQAQHSINQVQRGLDQATIDIRRAIASLQDEYPTQFTLQEQLESLIQEIDREGRQLHWENLTKVPLVLDVKDAEQVLRVVREALINAQKYSQASQVEIQLEQSDGCGIVRIYDNGLGFDTHNVAIESDRPHFGVKIMRARAARLGGRLDIDSLPGSGTRITLTWPLEKEHTHA